MKQRIYNKRKLMLTCATIIGRLALVIMMVQQLNTSKNHEYNENEAYLKLLEETADEMTEEQKLKFIESGEMVLVRLQNTIESDTTNPEERFYARLSVCLAYKRRDKNNAEKVGQ